MGQDSAGETALAQPSDTVLERRKSRRKSLAFIWENFGPTHDDRCRAVVQAGLDADVIGIQFTPRSEAYDWQSEPAEHFTKLTLFDATQRTGLNTFSLAARVIKACQKAKATHVFLCHYERPAIAIAAVILRLLGKRIFLLYDSKFDDYQRFIWRELFKSLWLRPYEGAIVASERSKDYLRFLGMPAGSIQAGYNTISLARIRRLAEAPLAPEGCSFEARHFTIIARFVEKKNLVAILNAYSIYAHSAQNPRPLRLFGGGALEASLREKVRLEKIEHLVTFEGFQQMDAICRALGSSLAVLLVSQEEQFGFAIIEALAMGVPVLISPACGAHDGFVRSAVNGFIVEPDNPEGMAFFMHQLAEDEALWRKMAQAACACAQQADVAHFAQSVAALIAH